MHNFDGIMRTVFQLFILFCAVMLFACRSAAQTDETVFFPSADSQRNGQLVSCGTAMETAWDLVRNPLADSIQGDPAKTALVRRGFRIFLQTGKYAGRFTGNDLTCGHCHLNAGQREKALPLVGISAVYPEFNKRSERVFSLVDRIVGCFLRSMNGSGAGAMLSAHHPDSAAAPIAASEEVGALVAYIDWLSEGHSSGDSLPWRGLNMIPESALVPIAGLDSLRGAGLFMEKCSNCHGEDGQGVAIGDIKAGPLWGPASWNDGAGAARVYTLAGMIRYMMPFIDPGSLTDEEAQQIAFFICSRPRPVYPFKSSDYRNGKVPVDALYYRSAR
jgi:thiosulfate dehydrogenase